MDQVPSAVDFLSFASIHKYLTGIDDPADNYATTGIASWIWR